MPIVCTYAGPPSARYLVPCDYHRNGAPKRHKCCGMCDRRGCREPVDTRESGATYCERHAHPRPVGRPVSTGSGATPLVQFRASAAVHAAAEAIARRDGCSVNALAKRAFEARVAEG